MKNDFQGYIFSRSWNGTFTPQRLQNMVVREYCKKLGKEFILSATEYSLPNCTMILRSLFKDFEKLGGIVFYTTHFLPKDLLVREELYRAALGNQCEIHFALEELVIRVEDDIALLEQIMMVRELAPTIEF